MKKASEVFKSIRFAKSEPRDKPHSSTDEEGHYTVGEKEYNQQLKHVKKMAMQEAKEKTEYDYEGDMARGQLQSIMNNAKRVHDMLEDNDNLPEWVQSKITLAEDYISTVANYMMSEIDEAFKMPPESVAEKMAKRHEELRKKSGLPDPSHYLKLAAQKKKEIEDMKKEEVELQEGRPSQRHPLEGHEYHKKSNEALIHIAKDAHAAAEAMKGHNTQAENKYRDQANDSATVRYFRQKSGMPDWYKKKYGHVKEEVELDEAIPKSTGHALVHSSSRKIVAKGNKAEMVKKMKELNSKEKGSHHLGMTNRGKVGDTFGEEVEQLEEKNVPTSPEKWAQAKAQAKAKFDVYPSAYANGWAAKKYKEMGGGWKSVSEAKEDLPFEPDKKPKKQQAVAGKHGIGYSTARHLARMAMQKQVEKMKKPIKEEEMSKKAQIVKGVAKKKKETTDAFQKDPIISKTEVKM